LQSWTSILTTVAACGGVGAFIDFWIGKQGQQRLRSWLETWWLKFSYVRFQTLGHDEALFAVRVIDRLVGRRLLSVRRLTAALIITVTSLVTSHIYYFLLTHIFVHGVSASPYSIVMYVALILMPLASVAISFSLTRLTAVLVARAISHYPMLNLIGLLFMLFFQYLLFCYMPLISGVNHLILSEQVLYYITQESPYYASPWELLVGAFDIISRNQITVAFTAKISQVLFPPAFWAATHKDDPQLILVMYSNELMNAMQALFRISITVVFLLSFVLQSIKRPILELWAKIIESDKPVFTLLFGGAAALVQLIQKIVSLFS